MKPNEDLIKYLKNIGLEITEKDCGPHDSVIRLTNVMQKDAKIQQQRKRHLENLKKI